MGRVGYAMSGSVILFLIFDATMKYLELPIVLTTTTQISWPVTTVIPLAVILTVCTGLYAFPRTSILGAVLLTAYLGGAVATHVRIGSPLFTHVLFGVYLGLLLWGGLYLRDARVRALLPLRSR
jgi:hypothetical protein